MIIDAETLLWLAFSALVLALWALYAVRMRRARSRQTRMW